MPVTVSVLPWWESSYMKFIQGWMCCIWESEWEFRKDKTMQIPVPVCHVDEKADEVYSWTTRRVLFRQWQSACCPTVQPKTVIIVWLCNQATVITGINRWLTENKNKKQSPTQSGNFTMKMGCLTARSACPGQSGSASCQTLWIVILVCCEVSDMF